MFHGESKSKCSNFLCTYVCLLQKNFDIMLLMIALVKEEEEEETEAEENEEVDG